MTLAGGGPFDETASGVCASVDFTMALDAWRYPDQLAQAQVARVHPKEQLPVVQPPRQPVPFDIGGTAVLPEGREPFAPERRSRHNADGSVDVDSGPVDPKRKESSWNQTMPAKGWFTAVRL